MNMDKLYIYALTEPDGETIRYIGCSKHPQKRLREHINQYNDNGRKTRWIRSLLENGKRPCLLIIDSCRSEIARDMEWKYYGYYKAIGCDLLNSTEHMSKTFREKQRKLTPQRWGRRREIGPA